MGAHCFCGFRSRDHGVFFINMNKKSNTCTINSSKISKKRMAEHSNSNIQSRRVVFSAPPKLGRHSCSKVVGGWPILMVNGKLWQYSRRPVWLIMDGKRPELPHKTARNGGKLELCLNYYYTWNNVLRSGRHNSTGRFAFFTWTQQ